MLLFINDNIYSIDSDEKTKLLNMENILKQNLIGQIIHIYLLYIHFIIYT